MSNPFLAFTSQRPKLTSHSFPWLKPGRIKHFTSIFLEPPVYTSVIALTTFCITTAAATIITIITIIMSVFSSRQLLKVRHCVPYILVSISDMHWYVLIELDPFLLRGAVQSSLNMISIKGRHVACLWSKIQPHHLYMRADPICHSYENWSWHTCLLVVHLVFKQEDVHNIFFLFSNRHSEIHGTWGYWSRTSWVWCPSWYLVPGLHCYWDGHRQASVLWVRRVTGSVVKSKMFSDSGCWCRGNVIKIKISSQSRNLSRKVEEKGEFYYWISLKLDCDMHHRQFTKRLQR